MFVEFTQKKKLPISLLIIAFFFCVFFLMPVNSNAVVGSAFTSVTGYSSLKAALSCNSDAVAIDQGKNCCLKYTTNTNSAKGICLTNMCVTNLSTPICKSLLGNYYDHSPNTILNCVMSGDPYGSSLGTLSGSCYQNVSYTYTDSSQTSHDGVIQYSKAPATQALKCGSKVVTADGIDFCDSNDGGDPTDSIGGHCLLPGEEINTTTPVICCKSKSDPNGKYTIKSTETECVGGVTPPVCTAGYQISNDKDVANQRCCKTMTDAELIGHCTSASGNTTSTCKITGYTSGITGCTVTIQILSSDICTVTPKKCQFNADQASTTPGSDPNQPNGGTNTGQTDNSPKTLACGVTGDSTTKVTAADCCNQNAATISDPTKASAERTNCNACLNKGPNFSWSGLGCINTSREGIVLSILRIFYGIGTGLLVLRIVIAGIRLINNPDSPDSLKESKQEISSSIVAFVFGVLTIILLRFIGISVLGISWIDNILPKLV